MPPDGARLFKCRNVHPNTATTSATLKVISQLGAIGTSTLSLVHSHTGRARSRSDWVTLFEVQTVVPKMTW